MLRGLLRILWAPISMDEGAPGMKTCCAASCQALFPFQLGLGP